MPHCQFGSIKIYLHSAHVGRVSFETRGSVSNAYYTYQVKFDVLFFSAFCLFRSSLTFVFGARIPSRLHCSSIVTPTNCTARVVALGHSSANFATSLDCGVSKQRLLRFQQRAFLRRLHPKLQPCRRSTISSFARGVFSVTGQSLTCSKSCSINFASALSALNCVPAFI